MGGKSTLVLNSGISVLDDFYPCLHPCNVLAWPAAPTVAPALFCNIETSVLSASQKPPATRAAPLAGRRDPQGTDATFPVGTEGDI